MGDVFGRPGVYRGTQQGMLQALLGYATGPTLQTMPVRVFEVNMYLTATATPNASNMILANCANSNNDFTVKTVLRTATSSSTAFLTVYHDQKAPVGYGQWKSNHGMLFPNGVFIQTATSMNYYTIVYSEVA